MPSAAIGAEISLLVEAFQFHEAGLRQLLAGPVTQDLVRRAIRVEAQAKRNASQPPPSVPGQGPSVRTGRLRGSITWRLGADTQSPYVDVGSAVSYCVFGGHTRVVTDKGARTIGQLLPGDRVLTQAGDFQRVLTKTAFPAVEKPDLVDLVIPWRADREHRLTLTLDHKVLCFRGGRNKWIAAGDLRDGDLLYDRIKLSHNKGVDTSPLKTCAWCQEDFKGQGNRYCSVGCRDDAWASGANPHLGAIRSEATRARISAKAKANQSGIRMNRILAQRGYKTSCERDVSEWLDERKVVYEAQVPFGGHVVDFFLPNEREIIEADGAYWHRDQARDVERDRALLADCPGVEITHIHFYDKRFSPEQIDPEPLPGVRYVVCNPGTDSFVDPAVFRKKPVRIERMWRYGTHLRPKGSALALLYDISVENVQSFLANSVVISNSAFVELGTSRAAARPYLRPALDAARAP